MPFNVFAQVNNPRICIFFIRAPVNGKRRNESVAFVNADKALENKGATSVIADTRFCGTRLDPTIKGSYSGIDENNFTPEDILLSTIIGMSQELYDMYRLIGKDCEKIVCSGNGIRKNPALRRVTAEMFGKKINIPFYKEEAAYGAALSAMTGNGIYSSLGEARRLIKYE